MRYLITVLVLLAACGKNSSGPSGIDPIVLITNHSTTDTVFFTWRDGQGVVGADTILAGQIACEEFFARPDSAYFEAIAAHGTYQQHWFDPTARHAWTMEYFPYGFLVTDRAEAPC